MSITDLDRRLARTPLAIVGLSSLFPGSSTISEFWNNVVDGVDSITEVPTGHWDVAEHYSPDRSAPDKTYATRGGFLDPVPFHPIDFGIPPSQLEVTDVLQLLSLVVARDVLSDARADEPWFDRSRTGVVLGVTGANQLTQPLSARLQGPAIKNAARSMGLSESDADELTTRFRAAFAPWEENSFPGMLGNVVAGRVANRFDLGGMNMTVDAACASSLGALRAAAAELLDHRADTMITGGCDAENTIFMYMCFSKTPAFSVSGQVSPFDTGADGTLIGEGIGMLALRRLADAERDGNRIYAVLRGIGSASDGRHKSIYAPAAGGQRLAIRRAYEDADCAPSSIGLVEAHGTGTAVGDATELSVLSEVLSASGATDGAIAVGSVKSQIGHTKAAAGAAGLIKLALALQHRVLPPTINVDRPADVFTDGPLHVSAEPRPWLPSPGRPVRRAGLSSFGFGGTDFHVVLEEHPAASEIGSSLRRPIVRVWSAETTAALLEALGTAPTGIDSGTVLPDGHPRLAVVAEDAAGADRLRDLAAERLRSDADRAWTDPRGAYYRPCVSAGRVGLLFAGQGSQYVNPGLTAVLREPVLLDAFEAAASTPGLEHLGEIAFPPPRFDGAAQQQDELRLRATEHAQPVIGALSVGHSRLLRELGLESDAFAGHSFGELTALWAVGSIADEDYFPLALARGSAMAAAAGDGDDPGAMAAVLADAATVERLLDSSDRLRVCNRNSPMQHVVGGPSAGIEELVRRGGAEGVRVVQLPVAAAFHTPIVAGARDRFGEAVAQRAVTPPKYGTVYANTTGAQYGDDTIANSATLVEQLAQPVDFVGVVERMYADGIRVFVECGPGRVLSRLVRSILGDEADVLVVALDSGDPKTSDQSLAAAVAQLVVAGVLPRWRFPHEQAAAPVPTGKGPAVYLTGVNHVPEQRRAAYAATLARPYRLETTSGALSTEAPGVRVGQAQPGTTVIASPSEGRREAQNMSVEPMQNPPMPHHNLAQEQWGAHAAFLAGQHQISTALLGMLQTPPSGGVDVVALEQVVRQCVAVSDTHVTVNRLVSGAVGDGQPSVAPATAGPQLPVEAPAPPDRTSGDWSATAAPVPAAAPAAPAAPVAEDPVDFEALVMEVVAAKTGYDEEILEREMGIEADLGIDSIKRVEILGGIGERFPDRAPFSPEEVAELRTLGDLVEALQGGPGARARESEAPGTAGREDADDSEVAIAVGRATIQWVGVAEADVPLDRLSRRVVVAGEIGPVRSAVADALGRVGHTVLDDLAHEDLTDADLVLVVEPAADAAALLADVLVRVARAAREAERRPEKQRRVLAIGVVDSRDPSRAGGVAPAGLAGLVRTLRVEHPHLRSRAVLLDLERAVDDADRVAAEFDDPADGIDTVRLGAEGRSVLRPIAAEATGPTDRAHWDDLTENDAVLVSGGARGITALCVRTLVERNNAPEYLLLGRSELIDEPAWSRDVLDEAGLRSAATAHLREVGEVPTPRGVASLACGVLAAREIRANVAAVVAAGGRARYVVADLTDRAQTARALAPWAQRITAVVHGAGSISDRLLLDKTADQARDVVATKLAGLEHVLTALPDLSQLRHLVLFSSAAGLFGNRGQSDYAAANSVLDRWAEVFAEAVPGAQAVAINWGAWEGGMVSDALREMFAERGYSLVSPDEGARLFREQFEPARASQQQVLLGPLRPLSERDDVLRPFVAKAPIGALMQTELVSEHVVGGKRTLPTMAALGLLVAAVARHSGEDVQEAHDLRVAAGIAEEDGDTRWAVGLDLRPTGMLHAQLMSLGDGPAGKPRPRFTASISRDGGTAAAAVPEGLARAVAAARPLDGPGPLFHGARLSSPTGLHRADDHVVVTGHRPLVPSPADATVGTFDPVALDAVLQAALVAAHVRDGSITLPSSAAAVRWYARVEAGTPIAVHVDRFVDADGGVSMRAVGAARGHGGGWAVFAEIDGLCLTLRPDMVLAGATEASA